MFSLLVATLSVIPDRLAEGKVRIRDPCLPAGRQTRTETEKIFLFIFCLDPQCPPCREAGRNASLLPAGLPAVGMVGRSGLRMTRKNVK